jgi:hypothetical protein
MKKIFLFVAVVAALSVNAEDKVWNFATIFSANQTFSVGDGQTPDALVEGELYVYGNAKDKAFAVEVNQSPKYFVDFLTIDDQVNADAEGKNGKLARLKSGGTGSVAADKIKGAVAFCVAGPSYIQIAAVSSSGTAVRKMQILNAAGEELASLKFDGNIGKKVNGEIVDDPFELDYKGGATTIFIVSAEAVEGDDSYVAGGINYYKIAATNVAPWKAPVVQGIEELLVSPKASKVVYNGQVVVVREGRMFNLLGAEVLK